MFVHVFVVYVMLQQTCSYSTKAVNFSQLLNEATLAELLCSAVLWSGLVWPCLVWAHFKPASIVRGWGQH